MRGSVPQSISQWVPANSASVWRCALVVHSLLYWEELWLGFSFFGYVVLYYYLYSLNSFAGPAVSDRRSHCSLHSPVSCPSSRTRQPNRQFHWQWFIIPHESACVPESPIRYPSLSPCPFLSPPLCSLPSPLVSNARSP